jgi:hypothetical protein
MAILYIAFGNRVIAPGLLAGASIPLLWIASYYGLHLGTWLGRDRLRKVTLVLLILMALSGLAAPWIGHR